MCVASYGRSYILISMLRNLQLSLRKLTELLFVANWQQLFSQRHFSYLTSYLITLCEVKHPEIIIRFFITFYKFKNVPIMATIVISCNISTVTTESARAIVDGEEKKISIMLAILILHGELWFIQDNTIITHFSIFLEL